MENLELSYESKCRRLHGHNYIITVYMVRRDQLNKDGMVYDFKHVKDRVHDYLDHGYLNELLPFNTTAENMSRWIVERLPSATRRWCKRAMETWPKLLTRRR